MALTAFIAATGTTVSFFGGYCCHGYNNKHPHKLQSHFLTNISAKSTREQGVCEVRKGKLLFQLQERLCIFASTWLRVLVLIWVFSDICTSAIKDANCIWSCRQGGCRNRHKQNMDTTRTEKENKFYPQKKRLLSAKVRLLQIVIKCNCIFLNMLDQQHL